MISASSKECLINNATFRESAVNRKTCLLEQYSPVLTRRSRKLHSDPIKTDWGVQNKHQCERKIGRLEQKGLQRSVQKE
jgi:hypothetical protein